MCGSNGEAGLSVTETKQSQKPGPGELQLDGFSWGQTPGLPSDPPLKALTFSGLNGNYH